MGTARPPEIGTMDRETTTAAELPKRKNNRLKCYDYSENGGYFITICTEQRKPLLSRIADIAVLHTGNTVYQPIPKITLTGIGSIVADAISEIPKRYEGVFVDASVIMPNHVHMMLRIEKEGGRAMPVPTDRPTLSRIMQHFKGTVTKRAHTVVWQSHFYDHVIRNETDYLDCMRYIEENPLKWLLRQDEYTI